MSIHNKCPFKVSTVGHVVDPAGWKLMLEMAWEILLCHKVHRITNSNFEEAIQWYALVAEHKSIVSEFERILAKVPE
jgi:hypothetical protein